MLHLSRAYTTIFTRESREHSSETLPRKISHAAAPAAEHNNIQSKYYYYQPRPCFFFHRRRVYLLSIFRFLHVTIALTKKKFLILVVHLCLASARASIITTCTYSIRTGTSLFSLSLSFSPSRTHIRPTYLALAIDD